MAEQAIVFIPDISGFTDFTTATEIDHTFHIISELLDIKVTLQAHSEMEALVAAVRGSNST